MTWFAYHSVPAIDPVSGELITSGTEGQIFATTDELFASPLPIFDLTGAPLSVVKIGQIPVTAEFQVQDAPEVRWKSGSYVLTLTSSSGLITMAQGADVKAQTALDGLTSLIELVSDAGADATTALQIAQATQDSLASASQLLPAGGADGDVLYRSGERAGVWGPPPVGTGSGGVTSFTQLTDVPATFPPSAHTHPSTQLSDATAVGRAVVTAATAQAARQAIGAGTGNGTSDLQLGTTATTAAPGNHAHAASAVVFTPTGGLSATNVQDAIAQAAQSGGGSGSSAVLVWRYTAGGWPALPSTKPTGVMEVHALGPSYPTTLPGWVGLAADKVPLSYSKVAVA